MNKEDEKTTLALLGDEAVGLGAIHAGLFAAYGYPGTPSTEILEYIASKMPAEKATGENFIAKWCSNEKTAMEAAIGTSLAGKRALVTMKHVGLNVAADPFMNSALLGINGGLVFAVADDPGMHSSQGEQDSRFYANFGLVPCLEPRNQQEAYDMVLEAFDLSEKFSIPFMLRLVTRLSHARAAVKTGTAIASKPVSKMKDRTRWLLLPANARRNYADLIEKQIEFEKWSAAHKANRLELEGRDLSFAVITSGLGGNYYEENLEDLISARGKNPAHLHIAAYPVPVDSIRKLCEKAEKVLVLEEGQPLIEKRLRGILPLSITINGKLDSTLSRAGDLDPDNVRKSLGLPPRPSVLDSG
ncbi:MAG: indolepyruvate ferredoxin oxidoreductase, partial [Treponema sp.]|nr:indolepyruvate ferredoxin oxidoreductase [Treponema sp.]